MLYSKEAIKIYIRDNYFVGDIISVISIEPRSYVAGGEPHKLDVRFTYSEKEIIKDTSISINDLRSKRNHKIEFILSS